ncbi:MAG: hypothetical protein AAF265_00560 [Pseudomonadota bacterium]
MRTLTLILIGILALGRQIASADDNDAEQASIKVVVNGSTLDRQQVNALISLYGSVQPGRYWYDTVSGLYGMESGPPAGQLHPGLNIGGTLSASASGGGNGRVTGVFINGREIHPMEYLFYQQLFGQVLPGRFWMNAHGMGGYEGGPAMFNVQQALAQASRRGGGGGSHYMEWIGGKPGTHVGRASDGCTYIVQGDYSAESC